MAQGYRAGVTEAGEIEVTCPHASANHNSRTVWRPGNLRDASHLAAGYRLRLKASGEARMARLAEMSILCPAMGH